MEWLKIPFDSRDIIICTWMQFCNTRKPYIEQLSQSILSNIGIDVMANILKTSFWLCQMYFYQTYTNLHPQDPKLYVHQAEISCNPHNSNILANLLLTLRCPWTKFLGVGSAVHLLELRQAKQHKPWARIDWKEHPHLPYNATFACCRDE